jgi:hypothetical protein
VADSGRPIRFDSCSPTAGGIGGPTRRLHAFVLIGNIMKNSFVTAIILPAALLGTVACDSGNVDHTLAHAGTWSEAHAARAAPLDGPRPPAYYGDEYADVQRALPDRRNDPFAPTF